MTDDLSADDVARALRLAGLPTRDLRDGHPGGFAAKKFDDVVLVVWTPAEELQDEAHRAIQAEPWGPAFTHLGRVKQVMSQAMIDILRSAGFDAHPVTHEYGPGDVEVRGTLQEPEQR